MAEYRFPYTAEEIKQKLDNPTEEILRYNYSIATLENKLTPMGGPVLTLSASKYSDTDSKGNYYRISLYAHIAMAYKPSGSNTIIKIVDHPLEFEVKSPDSVYPSISCSNENNLIDFGLIMDGEILSIAEAVKDIELDEEDIFKTAIGFSFGSGSSGNNATVRALTCYFHVYFRLEEDANVFQEEIQSIIDICKDTLFIDYKTPPAIIEKQGG